MTTQPDSEGAIAYALNRLSNELSPDLIYHNYWHSQADVLPGVVRLSSFSNISTEHILLLRVGAAFHDIGFVITHLEHERVGVGIAQQVLPDFGFTPAQIDIITGMIMATRLPQSPHTLLEEILADADLDVLGREDFFRRSEHLRNELANLGRSNSPLQWFEIQRNFLKNHSYFTRQARELRQPCKDQHIIILEEHLKNRRNGSGEPTHLDLVKPIP